MDIPLGGKSQPTSKARSGAHPPSSADSTITGSVGSAREAGASPDRISRSSRSAAVGSSSSPKHEQVGPVAHAVDAGVRRAARAARSPAC
jgi:hypothetical protein